MSVTLYPLSLMRLTISPWWRELISTWLTASIRSPTCSRPHRSAGEPAAHKKRRYQVVMLRGSETDNSSLNIQAMQSTGIGFGSALFDPGAASSYYFWGGSGAGANFFNSRSPEPEPHFIRRLRLDLLDLALVLNMTSGQFKNINMIHERLLLIINQSRSRPKKWRLCNTIQEVKKQK